MNEIMKIYYYFCEKYEEAYNYAIKCENSEIAIKSLEKMRKYDRIFDYIQDNYHLLRINQYDFYYSKYAEVALGVLFPKEAKIKTDLAKEASSLTLEDESIKTEKKRNKNHADRSSCGHRFRFWRMQQVQRVQERQIRILLSIPWRHP